jgi:glyoxylase-like metal-dependent hydrolase (beta-lactamase superfamily II)
MAVLSRRIGSSTVYALSDGAGTFFSPRREAFPTATEADWALADQFDPGAATGNGEWLLQFRAFAIRPDDGPVILVDAGIGPEDAPAAAWAPVPGKLPLDLAMAGIDPAEIGTVVLTHLHTDHLGWAVSGLFPNAGIFVQKAELTWISPRLDALLPHDQLMLIDGDKRLTDSVRIVATPGHTPGHQSVLVDSGDDLIAITGDLLVHALQLVAPLTGYSNEMDLEKAAQSRTALFATVKERNGVLATPHLTEPFVTPA